MTWGLVAVAGATVVSGVVSSRSAKKAAKAGEKGSERSADAIEFAADRARDDVFDFFPSAQQDLLAGAGAAGDILTGGVSEQQRLLSAGNIAAQNTLGQSFQTQKAALLGTEAPIFTNSSSQQQASPHQIRVQEILSQDPAFQDAMKRLAASDPEAFAQRIQDQPTAAFAAKQATLSQPLPNPLTGAPSGTPPPRTDSAQSAAGGLFSNVGQVPAQARAAEFGKLKTNQDVLTSILSGETEIPGIDIGFIEMLHRSPHGFGNGSVLTGKHVSSILNTPAKIDQYVKETIPNVPHLQEKLKTLVMGLQGIATV